MFWEAHIGALIQALTACHKVSAEYCLAQPKSLIKVLLAYAHVSVLLACWPMFLICLVWCPSLMLSCLLVVFRLGIFASTHEYVTA